VLPTAVFGKELAQIFQNLKTISEDLMNKHTTLSSALALVAGMVFSGATFSAAQNQSPSQQQQPPSQAPNQSGQQAPDSQASGQAAQGQVFAGTIMKSGDKYVLQDASGTSYDVDRQDLVKKYEGQKVRSNGTLDQDGKTIHVK
jgi:uncharacterized protein YdeI (BOF family)